MIAADDERLESLPRVAFLLSQLAAATLIMVVGSAIDAIPLWMTALAWWVVSTLGFGVPRLVASQSLVLIVTAVLLRLEISGLDLEGQAWGLAATITCALPFVLRPIRTLAGFPFLHVYCFVQGTYLYVATTVANPDVLGGTPYTPADRQQGFVTYTIFMAILVAAGCAATVIITNRRGTTETLPVHSRAFVRGLALVGAGTLIRPLLSLVGLTSALGQLATIPSLLKTVGFLVLLYLWFAGRLSTVERGAVVVLAGVDFVVGIGSGALYQGFALPLAALALSLAQRRRAPTLAIVLLLPVVLTLNAVKSDFRRLDRGGYIGGSSTSRGTTFLGLSTGRLLQMETEDFSASATRFAVSDTLGYTVRRVPSRYPYWDKRSYTLLPYVVIPRAVAPWKPTLNQANDFGRTYGLLHVRDFETSVNTPLVLEAYANFGYPGVVGIALFCGATLGGLTHLFRRDRPRDLVLGSVIAISLVQGLESGMSAWVLVLPTVLLLRPVSRWAMEG